jgi:FkbM family methyltransferase
MRVRYLLIGLAVGLAGGAAADRLSQAMADRQASELFWRQLADDPSPFAVNSARPYFAQQAEDAVIDNIFGVLKMAKPTYLDIGAADPVESSNTYLFYLKGGSGVLVEPNPPLAERLRAARPRDKVLNIGIAASAQKEADYYLFRRYPALNTFSREQADKIVSVEGTSAIEKVMKMPLVDINTVIAQNLGKAPDLLSVDTEGLDLEILKSLDFSRYRPAVICVETLELGTKQQDRAIVEFVLSQGYALRGATFVNSIFVDEQRLK